MISRIPINAMLFLLVPFTSAQAGDVDGNNMVDLADLIFLTTKLGTADPTADINGDGNVNIFDLVVVARNYSNDYNGQNIQPLFTDSFESGDKSHTENSAGWECMN